MHNKLQVLDSQLTLSWPSSKLQHILFDDELKFAKQNRIFFLGLQSRAWASVLAQQYTFGISFMALTTRS